MLIFLSLVFGFFAFLGGLSAVPIFTTMALWYLVRRRFSLAGKHFALALGAAAALAFCCFLIKSQPVEWPWAPAHAPLYALATLVFYLLFRASERWTANAAAR